LITKKFLLAREIILGEIILARGESLVRQWNLLSALHAYHFGICTDELAQRISCSKRQVQRDLNILQKIGFPLSFEQRDFGKRYWRLAQNFLQSNEICLSVTELLSLYLGKQLLAPLSGTYMADSFGSLIGKIKTLLPAKALNYFEELGDTLVVKSTIFKDYSKHDKKIQLLNQAIIEGKVLDLRYNSQTKGSIYQTLYHPYGLIFFNSSLYCIGYMSEYKEIRTLKIDRIADVKLTSRNFEKPSTFSLKSYAQAGFGIISSGKPRTIKIRFTGWAATMVREQKYHLSQQPLKDTPGEVTVQFTVTDSAELKRWVLSFGKYAIVLQPKSLIKSITDELRAVEKLYT